MENEHPIESLMRTTLDSIKNMVDVNTILGDPVETPDGKVIVPISRVTFGFAAGGTEYEPFSQDGEGGGRQGGGLQSGGSASGGAKGQGETEPGHALPFGGGSGAGISIQPVGFLVVGRDDMRLLPVDGQVLYDRLIDLAPRLLESLQSLAHGRGGRVRERIAGATDAERSAGAGAPEVVSERNSKPLIRLRSRRRNELS